MLRARDVMTKDVIWLQVDRDIIEAFHFMEEYSFRHLPVVDRLNRLVGIISDGDLLKSCRSDMRGTLFPSLQLKDVMTKDVVTCSPSCYLGNVAATMMACKINCVPVVYDDGTMCGIITSTDILDVYCRYEESSGHTLMPFDFVERKCLSYVEQGSRKGM